MIEHRDIIDLIPAYAIRALDEEEERLVAAHLTSCQPCQDELAAYEETVAQLAEIVPREQPGAHLKTRLMERIQPESQLETPPTWWDRMTMRLRAAAPVWVPVSAVLILVLLLSNILLWRQLNRATSREIMTVTLGGTAAEPDANGVLVLVPGQPEGTLVVDHLTPLPADQQYQLWLVEEDGNRDSGVVFSVDARGRAEVRVSGRKPLPEYSAFGITIEPTGGSPGPTGQQVLGSNL